MKSISTTRLYAAAAARMAPMTARDRGLRRLYVRSLPFILAAVVSVNLILTTALREGQLPIRLHNEGSLTHLVRVEQRATDWRYGFYLELGDVAAGQPLRVPEGSHPIVAWMTRGLSHVELQVSDYDPSALPPEAVPQGPPIGELETPDDVLIPYWILPGAGPRWMGYHQNGIVIVPDSVALTPGEAP